MQMRVCVKLQIASAQETRDKRAGHTNWYHSLATSPSSRKMSSLLDDRGLYKCSSRAKVLSRQLEAGRLRAKLNSSSSSSEWRARSTSHNQKVLLALKPQQKETFSLKIAPFFFCRGHLSSVTLNILLVYYSVIACNVHLGTDTVQCCRIDLT